MKSTPVIDSLVPVLLLLAAVAFPAGASGKEKSVAPIHSGTFVKDVLESSKPVLVDFSAKWCAPCRAMAPVVDSLASKYTGRVKFYTVDIDDDEELADDLDISVVPTFMIFSGGAIVSSSSGSMGKSKLDADISGTLRKLADLSKTAGQPVTTH